MKKIIRIYIAIIASVCLFMSLPADIYAVVIDVSSYNGFIQWDNMKNYIEGTIIRIGYGNDIQSQDDAAAIRNMDECERLGIPYGVYLYSYALDHYDAASETAHALRLQFLLHQTATWYSQGLENQFPSVQARYSSLGLISVCQGQAHL